MSKTAALIALLASQALPAMQDGASAPEWVHLLPAGEIATVDNRGPYNVRDLQAVITASFAEGDKLPIDQDHSTDLAAPNGQPAPARGWIVDLEARDDGLWGKVEWTRVGLELLADRAYRGISPVIVHDADNSIVAVLRASLVNQPNLRGLTALHSQNSNPMETNMSLIERMAQLLGQEPTATEDEVIAALEASLASNEGDADEAMQSALTDIGTALGVDGSDPVAILNAAKTAGGETTELKTQIATLSAKVTGMQDDNKKGAAERFVDAAIADLRVGLNSSNRDEYVALHTENPARTEKLINAMPQMTADGRPAPALQSGGLSPDATPGQVVAKANAYKAKQAAAGNDITFTQACMAVKEGKE